MRMVKGFVIGTICLVLVLAIALVGVLVMGLNGVLPRWNWDYYANLELANRQSFAAGDFDDFSVYYGSGRITLLPSSGSEIVVEEYMSRVEEDRLATISQSGKSLAVDGARPEFSINILNFNSWRCEMKVYVPRDWAGKVRLESTSGSVNSEGDFAFAGFAAKSTSGSVRVQSVTSAGNIELQSTSGSVNGETLTAEGDVFMKSTSGSVNVNTLTAGGDVTMQSTSGSVNGEVLTVGGNVSLKSSSGSVRPGDVTAMKITAESTSGSVKFGRAAAATITASSSSGGVKFERIDGVFDLKSTSGSVTIEDGIGSGRAETSSGSVKVTLEELSGDLSMKSTSGSCRLTVGECDMDFHATTNSGSIKTPNDDALSFDSKGKKADGTFGKAGVHYVEMHASSGSVTLEWR